MAGTTWISVSEAARRLVVTHTSIHNWIATKKLTGKKLPPLNFWVVSATSVERLRKERADADR